MTEKVTGNAQPGACKLICFLVSTGHIHKLFPLLYVFVPLMARVKKAIKGQTENSFTLINIRQALKYNLQTPEKR